MKWTWGCGTDIRMGRLWMKETLLVHLIGDEIRLNVRHKECSREVIENREVLITVGNI